MPSLTGPVAMPVAEDVAEAPEVGLCQRGQSDHETQPAGWLGVWCDGPKGNCTPKKNAQVPRK